MFRDVCNNGTFFTNRSCILKIPGFVITSNNEYQFSISGRIHNFTLTLTKDTRSTKRSIFVTVIDSNSYPRCSIVPNLTSSINTFQTLSTSCIGTNAVRYTYLWYLYDWSTSIYLPETRFLTYTSSLLRIPPYLISSKAEELFI